MNSKLAIIGLLVLAAVVLAGCSKAEQAGKGNDNSDDDGVPDKLPTITLYKSEQCGCCDLYLRYLEKNDYTVIVNEVDDVTPIKDKYGLPRQLRSCHTSVIGDYFVEGHVPVEAIQKLMTERPDIKGIALPGMPSGSPGMPGAKQSSWTIYAVGKEGTVSEFMKI